MGEMCFVWCEIIKKIKTNYRGVFVNPETGDVWEEGDIYTWPSLADTYELVAVNGIEEFYSGQTGINMIADMQAAGGEMSLQDLENYS